MADTYAIPFELINPEWNYGRSETSKDDNHLSLGVFLSGLKNDKMRGSRPPMQSPGGMEGERPGGRGGPGMGGGPRGGGGKHGEMSEKMMEDVKFWIQIDLAKKPL